MRGATTRAESAGPEQTHSQGVRSNSRVKGETGFWRLWQCYCHTGAAGCPVTMIAYWLHVTGQPAGQYGNDSAAIAECVHGAGLLKEKWINRYILRHQNLRRKTPTGSWCLALMTEYVDRPWSRAGNKYQHPLENRLQYNSSEITGGKCPVIPRMHILLPAVLRPMMT